MSEVEKKIRKAIKNLKKLLEYGDFHFLTSEKILSTINNLECDLMKLTKQNDKKRN